MNKVPMTVRGHELLQDELKQLKGVERPISTFLVGEQEPHRG